MGEGTKSFRIYEFLMGLKDTRFVLIFGELMSEHISQSVQACSSFPP